VKSVNIVPPHDGSVGLLSNVLQPESCTYGSTQQRELIFGKTLSVHFANSRRMVDNMGTLGGRADPSLEWQH